MKPFARHLRSRENRRFTVASTDGLDPDQAVVDFYSLVGRNLPIAASHGRGVLSLLEHGFCRGWMMSRRRRKRWMKTRNTGRSSRSPEQNGEEAPEDDFDPQSLPIKLAIVGRPNVRCTH